MGKWKARTKRGGAKKHGCSRRQEIVKLEKLIEKHILRLSPQHDPDTDPGVIDLRRKLGDFSAQFASTGVSGDLDYDVQNMGPEGLPAGLASASSSCNDYDVNELGSPSPSQVKSLVPTTDVHDEISFTRASHKTSSSSHIKSLVLVASPLPSQDVQMDDPDDPEQSELATVRPFRARMSTTLSTAQLVESVQSKAGHFL